MQMQLEQVHLEQMQLEQVQLEQMQLEQDPVVEPLSQEAKLVHWSVNLNGGAVSGTATSIDNVLESVCAHELVLMHAVPNQYYTVRCLEDGATVWDEVTICAILKKIYF